MTTEVAAQQTAMVPKDFGKYTGAGREKITQEDYSLPFLQILQTLSKSVENGVHEAGDIFHSTTKEAFNGAEGVSFIPVFVNREFVEWVPRTRGGGLAGKHKSSSSVVLTAKLKQQELDHAWNELYANDHDSPKLRNELVETGLIYGLLVREDGSMVRVCIPCKVTHLKAYKNFNSICADIPGNPPLFALKFKLETIQEKRQQGNSYNWIMSFDGDSPNDYIMGQEDERFLKGAKFWEDLQAELVTFDHSKMNETVSSTTEDDDTPF